MFPKFLVLILIGAMSFACVSESNNGKGSSKEKKLSEKSDLRKSMNGFWILISQSFTKGKKLQKFPVGGTVSLIIDENDRWCTITRRINEPEDTVSYGSFSLDGDRLVFNVEKTYDESGYSTLDAKVSLKGRFMQVEGKMYFDNNRKPVYMHMMLGRSERTLEEIFFE